MAFHKADQDMTMTKLQVEKVYIQTYVQLCLHNYIYFLCTWLGV